MTLTESRVATLRANIDAFRVIDSFAELEAEANGIVTWIRRQSDQNSMDATLIDQLRATYENEAPPSAEAVSAMYTAAGIQLGDLVRRRFEEVAEFHQSIVRNRTRHLRDEIAQAEERIHLREVEKRGLDERRSQLFGILRSGGALSELPGLQEELARAQARLCPWPWESPR